MMARNVEPSSHSIAMNNPAGDFPDSYTVTMFGWRNAEAARASVSKRSTACEFTIKWRRRIFSATGLAAASRAR